MRDADETTGSLCSYVDLEKRVPARHPLRTIRRVVSGALARLDSEFDRLHADFGRPSIAPERLTRAGLLQILFSVRVAPEACLRHDAAPDRAAGLQPAVPMVCRAWHRRQVWVQTLFSKNRDSLLTMDMSRKVMAAILAHREVTVLLSDGHVSVDGTLVKAWASMKRIRPKEDGDPGDPGDPPAQDAAQQDPSPQPDPEPRPMSRPASRSRNAEVDFRGRKRTNATHASTTDADARRYRKSPGTGAMLCFIGHAVMENRSEPAVQGDLTRANGRAERKAALEMMHRHARDRPGGCPWAPTRHTTLPMIVADCKQACLTPHVARKARFSATAGQTDAAQGLCPDSETPEADRGALRLVQDRRRRGADPLSRHGADAVTLHPHPGRRKPCPAPRLLAI